MPKVLELSYTLITTLQTPTTCPAQLLIILQLFTDIAFNKTESGAEKRELFSVVQSDLDFQLRRNFLVSCSPTPKRKATG